MRAAPSDTDSRLRPRQAYWVAALGLVSVTLGFQMRRPVEITLGEGLTAALLVEGFHDAEGGYRWTRGLSTLVLPDPGPGVAGRLELEISGFRPPGLSPPLVVIETLEADRQTVRARPGNRVETITFPIRPKGWWRSDLPIRFRSETFTPGDFDRRPLGVRVHRVRFLPDRVGLVWGRPPLRSLLLATAAVWLLLTVLLRVGLAPNWALGAALLAAVSLGMAFAFVRPQAVLATTPLLVLLLLAYLWLTLFPGALRTWRDYGSETARAAAKGLVLLRHWQAGVLFLAGALGVTAATLSTPSFTVDVGSGSETGVARGFGPFDSASGVNYRRPRRGAEVDLRDFGGGSPWTISVTAALAQGGPRSLTVARAGPELARQTLDEAWSSVTFQASAPVGWRSGLRIEFPEASDGLPLRIDRLRVDRGRSLPSPRLVLALTGAALLLFVSFGAVGLGPSIRLISALAVVAGETVALAASPVLAVPFSASFLGIVALSLALALILSGVWAAEHRRGRAPAPVPGAAAWTVVGFVAWLAAMTFPLYRGQHFGYHSSIAEEIWQGRFLVFYLPHPENILSREAQWGGMVVPYPCLYHTLIAPLAALPQPWFYFLEKIALAVLLASTTLAAALLAHRFGGRRAAVLAAALTVSQHPSYQLLGLGHLLTVFGCWAATLGLGYLVASLEALPDRAIWWKAAGFLALCFLSYTASLLFGAVAVLATVALLWRSERGLARRLLGVALTAGLGALLLYYIHWVLPFLRESLPILLAGEPEGPIAMGSRLWAIPRKLAYSYGSALIPLGGLAGLAWTLRASRDKGRLLLACWAFILPLFSGLDVFFNFILKHHYFVMVPMAVGSGLALSKLTEKGPAGRAVATGFFVYAISVGGKAALELALGQMD